MAEGEGRVFLRGLSSETYGLGEFRRRQRAADRVRRAGTVVDDANVAHSGDPDQSRTSWMLGPGQLFKQLGHDNIVYLEDASAGRQKAATA